MYRCKYNGSHPRAVSDVERDLNPNRQRPRDFVIEAGRSGTRHVGVRAAESDGPTSGGLTHLEKGMGIVAKVLRHLRRTHTHTHTHTRCC